MRLLALALLFFTSGQAPQADDTARLLIGSWRLVSYEDRLASGGPTVFPYGHVPQGLLIYDATGHMAIQIMKAPHPTVASSDDTQVTPAEKQALFDAYVAYFGTYRVDAAKGGVIVRVEADLADVFIDATSRGRSSFKGIDWC